MMLLSDQEAHLRKLKEKGCGAEKKEAIMARRSGHTV